MVTFLIKTSKMSNGWKNIFLALKILNKKTNNILYKNYTKFVIKKIFTKINKFLRKQNLIQKKIIKKMIQKKINKN